jgi:REP element-mobilizing transposase RayT
MPFTRIWIHAVWTTKKRTPSLLSPHRKIIYEHIKENSLKKDIYIDTVNGWMEHIHLLLSLKASQNLSKVIQLIKGESSYWINNNYKKLPHRFEWQEEYFGASVSHNQVSKVRAYIRNQEIHHKTRSFKEEFDEFLRINGLEL